MRSQLARRYEEDLLLMNDRDPIQVTAEWDPEAQVWVAISDEVPGLVAEAASLNELIPTLEDLIPQLLRDNGAPSSTMQKSGYHVTAHITKSLVVA